MSGDAIQRTFTVHEIVRSAADRPARATVQLVAHGRGEPSSLTMKIPLEVAQRFRIGQKVRVTLQDATEDPSRPVGSGSQDPPGAGARPDGASGVDTDHGERPPVDASLRGGGADPGSPARAPADSPTAGVHRPGAPTPTSDAPGRPDLKPTTESVDAMDADVGAVDVDPPTAHPLAVATVKPRERVPCDTQGRARERLTTTPDTRAHIAHDQARRWWRAAATLERGRR